MKSIRALSLTTALCLSLAIYFSLGNAGCGSVYPSYSGVYRLKEPVQDSEAAKVFPVIWPKEIIVYQFPFKKNYKLQLENIVAIGSREQGLSGVFFKGNALDEKDSLDHALSNFVTMTDFDSDPVYENGQQIGHSCVFTYGNNVNFKFSPGSHLLTHSVNGAYPSEVLANPDDPRSAYRGSQDWRAMPVNTSVWAGQEVSLTITFSAFKRFAYGHYGGCEYNGVTTFNTISVAQSATYERVDEIESGDLRDDSNPTAHEERARSLLNDARELWPFVFDVPADGAAFARQLADYFKE